MNKIGDRRRIESWQKEFALPGVYAVVGAGGKTTLCFAAAKELQESGKKVVVTTTTHMFPEDDFVPETNREQVLSRLEQKGYVFTGGEVKDGKVTSVSEHFLLELKEKADYVLVEADGSARYPLKAPAAHEPVVPSCVDFLVVVGGMAAVGHPIHRVCHRVHRVCEILNGSEDDIVTLEKMAEILWKGYGEQATLPTQFILSQWESEERGKKTWISWKNFRK